MRKRAFVLLCALACFPAFGAKIGEIEVEGQSVVGQLLRFLTLSDPAVRLGLTGSVFLGLTCGLLGAFIVLRRLSLMGDVLGHSVLPGIVLGFLATGTKAPIPLFIGALGAGALATAGVSVITQQSRIKQDSAMGIILSGFFGAGIVLLTRVQKLPFGNQSGLDKFLFGQAAAIGPDDVLWMGVMTALSVLLVLFFFRQLTATSFDEPFAQSIGIPVKWIHYLLMVLLTVATVISIQAVGVVLVSAMLIIPATTAYLLTDKMRWMLILSATFGILSGVLGALFSFLGPSLPTGPFMVVAAAVFFTTAFLFAPRYGVVVRSFRQRAKRKRTIRENLLKSLYHAKEQSADEPATVARIAALREETPDEIRRGLRNLLKDGFVTLSGDTAELTVDGLQRAFEIVRNHRLWELYLTREAEFAANRVHDDAEEIEHVLGEDIVRDLEETLQYPDYDPHGRRIPSLRDLNGAKE